MPATTPLERLPRRPAVRGLRRVVRRVTGALAAAEARHWGTPLHRDPR